MSVDRLSTLRSTGNLEEKRSHKISKSWDNCHNLINTHDNYFMISSGFQQFNRNIFTTISQVKTLSYSFD